MIHDETIENIQWGKNFLLNPIFKNIFLGLRNHLPGLGRKKKKKKKKNEKKK